MTDPQAAYSYRLLLPPGWRQLPLDMTARKAVDEILDGVFKDLPRDTAAPYRGEVRKMLMAQIDKARESDALDLYLPLEPIRGRPAAASFLVAHLPADPDEPVNATVNLFASLADEPGSSPITVGKQPAMRTEVLLPQDPEDPMASLGRSRRQVSYQVSVPGGGLLVISVSTVVLEERDNPTAPDRPDGPRFDNLLVELFDAIVSTLRWAKGVPS